MLKLTWKDFTLGIKIKLLFNLRNVCIIKHINSCATKALCIQSVKFKKLVSIINKAIQTTDILTIFAILYKIFLS